MEPVFPEIFAWSGHVLNENAHNLFGEIPGWRQRERKGRGSSVRTSFCIYSKFQNFPHTLYDEWIVFIHCNNWNILESSWVSFGYKRESLQKIPLVHFVALCESGVEVVRVLSPIAESLCWVTLSHSAESRFALLSPRDASFLGRI